MHDDGSNFVSRRDLIINFLKNFLSRHVRSGVCLLEDFLVLTRETIVDCLDSLSGNNFGDLSGDGLASFDEGLLGAHSLALVSTIEGLNNSVNCTKENSTLAIDVGFIFRGQGSFEHKRRSESNTPSKGKLICLSRFVLVDSEGSVDSSSVDLFSLLVQTTNRGSHTFGAHRNNIHILREALSDRFKVSEQETVRKSKSGTRLHGSENFFVQGSLGSITDEKHYQVGLLNDIKHFTKGVSVLGEADLTGLLEG
mmetsp:Transcript_24426/g.50249  ORF Transcript_24426/g.50249 Transcript_24426/m.50249 type:complete len:253 (-) Transcript_24426:578-1336(-)